MKAVCDTLGVARSHAPARLHRGKDWRDVRMHRTPTSDDDCWPRSVCRSPTSPAWLPSGVRSGQSRATRAGPVSGEPEACLPSDGRGQAAATEGASLTAIEQAS